MEKFSFFSVLKNIFANDTSDKGLISKIFLKTHTTQQQEGKQSI